MYDNNDIYKIIDLLKNKKLIYEKDNAVWFKGTKVGRDVDRVLIKNTGEPTYRLPDIAYHKTKFERNYDLIIDVFGADHMDAYPDVLEALNQLGYDINKVKVMIHQFVTVLKDGWHGDTSKMFLVGKSKPHNQRLVRVTQECLYKAIEIVRPGNTLGDIGNVIQCHAEKNYYSVVEDYCGHGIGQVYHEEPQILHYGKPESGLEIREGMCFTIEPMINLGSKFTKCLPDGWTVETKDGRNSAQWEHTLAVTWDGCEVLTKREEENI